MKNISVVIPTYNHSKFVGEAIESVLSNNGVCTEIIVVNDNTVATIAPNTAKIIGINGNNTKIKIIIIANIIPQIIRITFMINWIVLIIPRNIVIPVYSIDMVIALARCIAIRKYCIIRLIS